MIKRFSLFYRCLLASVFVFATFNIVDAQNKAVQNPDSALAERLKQIKGE